jgi:hypothetical protein
MEVISNEHLYYGNFIKEVDAVNLDLPCYRIVLVYAQVHFLVDFWFVDFVKVEHRLMRVNPIQLFEVFSDEICDALPRAVTFGQQIERRRTLVVNPY